MSRFVSTILYLILFIIQITNTSNVYRSQESSYQNRNNKDQQNAHQIQSQQSPSAKPVYDILVSIDERIRLLEAYDDTYKLTRIDFTLEQLSQRMASIESKLSRLETDFNSKLAKVEDILHGKELKEELRSESIARKMEDLNDKINNKAVQIDAKFEIKIDQISNKLDSFERFMHTNSEEVLEKLIKYEERHTVFESHVKSHINNIENLVMHSLDASTNIKEMVNYNLGLVDKLITTVKDCKHLVSSQLDGIVTKLQNSTSISHSLNKQQNRCPFQRQETSESIRRMTSSEEIQQQQTDFGNNTNTNKNSRNIEETKELSNNIYNNISSNLAQLDVHVDYYSRKIINTVQEIWKTSQSSESYLREALDMANKTRSFIRQEFKRLQEQIAPLNKTPNFSNIREPLEQKLHQLSTTVDDSFSAVMISQNSFISSCNRIQEEEEQLYDILDDMLLEIRNKSSFDVSLINYTINTQTVMINNSLNELLSEIKSTSDKVIYGIKKDILLNVEKYSSGSESMSSDKSECFLTRNEIMNVCNKSNQQMSGSNIITNNNNNQNNEQTVEEKSEDKIEPNYEDLSQTE